MPKGRGLTSSALPAGGVVLVQPVGTTMYRGSTILTATIANGAALSAAFDMSSYAGGMLHMPAGWTAACVGFQISPTVGGTYQPLYEGDGTLAQIENDDTVAIAGLSYALPAEMFGVQWVKLWSENGAGVGVNQGGDRVFNIDLKA